MAVRVTASTRVAAFVERATKLLASLSSPPKTHDDGQTSMASGRTIGLLPYLCTRQCSLRCRVGAQQSGPVMESRWLCRTLSRNAVIYPAAVGTMLGIPHMAVRGLDIKRGSFEKAMVSGLWALGSGLCAFASYLRSYLTLSAT